MQETEAQRLKLSLLMLENEIWVTEIVNGRLEMNMNVENGCLNAGIWC